MRPRRSRRSTRPPADPRVADPANATAVLRIRPDVQADLDRLHPWLLEAADHLPKSVLRGMAVALEEAVMNVVMHAFPPGVAGDIGVRLTIFEHMAELVVDDPGPPFDPTQATARARAESLADIQPGGFGLTLLKRYCRDCQYQRTGGHNVLTMRFSLPRT